MVTIYVWAFVVGMFLGPALLLAGFSWALERPGITDRGITSTVVGFGFLALTFVTLWAWILPNPGELS
jgi:hypothetical protein